jgi:hypothetical protein
LSARALLLRDCLDIDRMWADLYRTFDYQVTGGALASRVWDLAGAFRVVIAEPLLAHAGKLLPLHISRRSE